MFLINPFIHGSTPEIFPLAGPNTFMTRSGAIHTRAGYSFGPEGPRRKIIIPIMARRYGSTSMSLVSATIGGVSAEVLAYASGTVNGVRNSVYLLGAEPDGTSGDIVCTMSVSDSDLVVQHAGYSVFGLRSMFPQSSLNVGQIGFNASSTNTRSVVIDVPPKGIVIAATSINHDSGSHSFTGVTHQFTITGYTNQRFYAGSLFVEAGEIGKTVSFSKSGGAESMYGGLVAVGLR